MKGTLTILGKSFNDVASHLIYQVSVQYDRIYKPRTLFQKH